MSITLEFDEDTLASLPFGPGERERLMQIELACRFYAKGWVSLGQAARMARLDRYALGAELAERGIPRQYGPTTSKLTSGMRVVSNTSPLSNLAIIGQLGLVREQLRNLLIPPAVHAELLATRIPTPVQRSAPRSRKVGFGSCHWRASCPP